MRSALVHVLADGMRAIAVIVIALTELIKSEAINLSRVDAWVAFFISLTIILGSLYAFARSAWSWYHELHVNTDPKHEHSHKAPPVGVTAPEKVTIESNEMNKVVKDDKEPDVNQDRV